MIDIGSVAYTGPVAHAGPDRITIRAVQDAVVAHCGVSRAVLLGPSRKRPHARPRQIAMWLCRACTDASFPEIGHAFGGRDHTTIMHGVAVIDGLVRRDAEVALVVDELRRGLEA